MAVNLLPAYSKVTWQGQTFNRRTLAALKWAQARAGIAFLIAQGSYNGSVGASAGTHDGGGAVDVRVFTQVLGHERKLTDGEIRTVVRALKDAGFCAWHRGDNWDGAGGGEHIHGILRGDVEMSPGAASQVPSFDARRNGLRNNAPDATYRPSPRVRFNYLLNRPRPV